MTLASNYGGLGFKVGTNPTNNSDFAYLLSIYYILEPLTSSISEVLMNPDFSTL